MKIKRKIAAWAESLQPGLISHTATPSRAPTPAHLIFTPFLFIAHIVDLWGPHSSASSSRARRLPVLALLSRSLIASARWALSSGGSVSSSVRRSLSTPAPPCCLCCVGPTSQPTAAPPESSTGGPAYRAYPLPPSVAQPGMELARLCRQPGTRARTQEPKSTSSESQRWRANKGGVGEECRRRQISAMLVFYFHISDARIRGCTRGASVAISSEEIHWRPTNCSIDEWRHRSAAKNCGQHMYHHHSQ